MKLKNLQKRGVPTKHYLRIFEPMEDYHDMKTKEPSQTIEMEFLAPEIPQGPHVTPRPQEGLIRKTLEMYGYHPWTDFVMTMYDSQGDFTAFLKRKPEELEALRGRR